MDIYGYVYVYISGLFVLIYVCGMCVCVFVQGVRCKSDKSVICRMEVLNKYCLNPSYNQMCCKSCSESNFTSNLNLTTSITVSPRSHHPHTTQPITHISTPRPSSTSTPWRYTTALYPLSLSRGTAIPSIAGFILEETDGPSTSSDEEETTEPWSVHMMEEVSESTSGFEELLPTTTEYVVTEKSLATSTTQGRFTGTSLPTVVNLHISEDRKENNSVDVPYRVVNGNEVTQNYFIPKKRVLVRERTQNRRIQQLLEERRRQDFLKRLKRKPGD